MLDEDQHDRLESLKKTLEAIAMQERSTKAQSLPAWNPELNGGFEYPFKTNAERDIALEMRRIMRPASRWKKNKEWLISSYDAVDLDFDDAMILDFIAAVEELKAITTNVYVIVLPRNQSHMALSTIGQQRLEAVLARIHGKTQAPVWNLFSDPDFSHEDFADSMHLNEVGGFKLSVRLADLLEQERAKISDPATIYH